MLLQFSIKNFRTFKDKATLSLIASNYHKEREDDNIVVNESFKLRILKSAVIYGANASGKSKLIEAFAFMRHFVLSSSKESQKGEAIGVAPFLLSTETENSPTEFEVIFIYENKLYRYGFEATTEKIISEWLFQKPKTKEIKLFYREENEYDIHSVNFSKGLILAKSGLVRDNALLISVAAQFNEITAISVLDWFMESRTLSGVDELDYQGFTMSQTDNPEYKANILKLLKAADFGIQDVELQEMDVESLPRNIPKELRDKIIQEIKDDNRSFVSDVLIKHKKYDNKKIPVEKVSLSMEEDESSGTRKFFAMAGPILYMLENGYTLFVDELDSKLHPNLVCKIISLFNSKELNKKNAQLIFNTHDTNLLNSGLFRRDQIWFTSKDKYGEAKLYSLADFKSAEVRKTEQFEDNYIRGKYGAVPFLGFFDTLDLSSNRNEK